MITYYVVGSWMGPFRTVSTISTIKEFKEWAKEQGITKKEDGVWRTNDNKGYVVIELLEGEL